MRPVLTLLLFIYFASSGCSRAQSVEEAGKLYSERKYEQALSMSYSMLKNDSTAAFANSLIGRILTGQKKYDSAIPYLQLALKLDNDKTYISAWSHAYLGVAYIYTHEKEKGVSELNKTVALHITNNSVQFARHYLQLANESPWATGMFSGPDWVIIEGTNITYCFQDTTGISYIVTLYIDEHEKAYTKINAVFQATLPKKLKLYVWNDRLSAKKILGRELGYTDPERCIINAAIDQTVGHEMTHALSYWGWGYRTKAMTRFINEGVSVAFDQSNRDRNEMARRSIKGENIHSVLDLWKNENAAESVLYPVGGAFVNYLQNKCTPEQFKAIIKDQSIENAERVLGKGAFDHVITEFNKMIGI